MHPPAGDLLSPRVLKPGFKAIAPPGATKIMQFHTQILTLTSIERDRAAIEINQFVLFGNDQDKAIKVNFPLSVAMSSSRSYTDCASVHLIVKIIFLLSFPRVQLNSQSY